MSKVCLLTDTHYGARSDSVPFDNFFRRFYMEKFWSVIDERKITTIVHLGDCFDRRKYINYNTLKTCREYFFDQAKKRNIDLRLIVGNHDVFYKNTNDVNSADLLLNEYTNITTYASPSDITVDGRSILMLPWICADNYDESMEAINTTKSRLVLGHLEIAGFLMYRGHESEEGLDSSVFKKFDLVCSGHYHHRSKKDNICYLGNPYEMTWQDYDDPRGFNILDTETLELEFIQNPFTIFTKFYYDEDQVELSKIDLSCLTEKFVKLVVVNKQDFYKFDRFMERLYKQNPLEVKIIEDLSEFESDTTVDEDVNVEDTLSLLSQYVDAIETDANKDKIKTLMRTLYVEAQNVEEE